jgi:DNA mismatch endonuclease (patch repair protein)
MALSRSEQMSRIHGSGTRPESALAALLLPSPDVVVEPQGRTPVGRADFVLRGPETVAVFVDGCFWHGCPDHYVRPGSREEYWAQRLHDNVARDRRQTLALEAAGWKVVRAWEHEVFTELEAVVNRIEVALGRGDGTPPPVAWRVMRVDVLDPEARIERRFLVDLRDADQQAQIEGRRRTTQWRRSGSRRRLSTTNLPRDPDARS